MRNVKKKVDLNNKRKIRKSWRSEDKGWKTERMDLIIEKKMRKEWRGKMDQRKMSINYCKEKKKPSHLTFPVCHIALNDHKSCKW